MASDSDSTQLPVLWQPKKHRTNQGVAAGQPQGHIAAAEQQWVAEQPNGWTSGTTAKQNQDVNEQKGLVRQYAKRSFVV